MTTQQGVISLIAWFTKRPDTQICVTTNLRDDLNLDNIDMMILMLKMERLFKIDLSKEEVECIETVKDICECVHLHLQQQISMTA